MTTQAQNTSVRTDVIVEAPPEHAFRLFTERFDLRRINFVSPQKFAMTLIKLPERSIRPLPIDPERGREF